MSHPGPESSRRHARANGHALGTGPLGGVNGRAHPASGRPGNRSGTRRPADPAAYPTLLPPDFPSPTSPVSPVSGVRTRREARRVDPAGTGSVPVADDFATDYDDVPVWDITTGQLPLGEIPVPHDQTPGYDPLTGPPTEGRHLPVAPVWQAPLQAPVSPGRQLPDDGRRPTRVLHEPPPTSEHGIPAVRPRTRAEARAAGADDEPPTRRSRSRAAVPADEPRQSRSRSRAQEREDAVDADGTTLGDALRDTLLNGLAGARITPHGLRLALYRRFGIDVHDARVLPGSEFHGDGEIYIAPGALIGRHCLIEADADVEIGAGTRLGAGVTLITSDGVSDPQPIRIGDRCRIGARATILPGVTIGDDVIVLPGTVVAEDVPANGTYG